MQNEEMERLQILTEIVSTFRTAILMEEHAEQTGKEVLDIVQQAGDAFLTDKVLDAYMKRSNPHTASQSLDQAIRHLHQKIDLLVNEGQ